VTPEKLVRAELERADRLRRSRGAAHQLWRVAPIAAGICAAVAAAGRFAGWPSLFPLALLAIALAALVTYAWSARRARAITDTGALELDERARLDGELRSAYWFAEHDTRDAWIDFHLGRAAERLKAIDWSGLYPAARATRSKTATAVLALATLVLALFVPGRSVISAIAGGRGTAAVRGKSAVAPLLTAAEILARLENLLIAAETGRGRAITAEEVRGLMAQLDQLMAQKKIAEASAPKDDGTKQSKLPTAAELKAYAERAKRASASTDLEPEVRDALEDMSQKLDEQAQAQNAAPKDPRDAVNAEESPSGESAQAAAGSGNKQDPSAQSVKEAAGAGGMGVIMMTGDSSSSKEAGLGLGGASGANPKNGQMPDLGAALRRETIEAAREDEGEKTVSGERRQTEHGDATAAYTRTAPAAADRGRSAAPPAVPEARRAALRSYFIRKQ
jgi:hypothetical protein